MSLIVFWSKYIDSVSDSALVVFWLKGVDSVLVRAVSALIVVW